MPFDVEQWAKSDPRLRVARWHLDQLRHPPPSAPVDPAGGHDVFAELARLNLPTDHADVVTVFSAATVEARLNLFVISGVMFMEEAEPRRFLAELITKYLRLDVPRKIKFLRNRVPSLKDNTLLPKVQELSQRRNAILHTSFEYEEVKSLPDQPYVPALHDHLPESAFEQRPSFPYRRTFPLPALEQAEADYAVACDFLQLMFDVVPWQPWPPPRFRR